MTLRNKTNMEDLISVIVPVYNVDQYLKECIDSILEQTYTSFELILVDDGSTDNSGIICDEYANRDQRIKVIHQKNGGLGNARNVALKIVAGKYIAIVDSDDWIDKNMLAGMYSEMKEFDADIIVAGHNIVNLDNSLEKIINGKEPKLLNRIEATSLILEDKFMHSFTWDKMYKRELFEGITYPENFLIEDIFTTYKLMNKSKKILLSDKAYYFYRRRETGLCLNPDPTHVYKKQMSYYRAFYERYQFVSLNKEFSPIFNICQDKAFNHGRNLLHVNIKDKLDKSSSSFYEILGDLSSMNLKANNLISKGKKIEHMIIRNMPSRFYILLLKTFYSFTKQV